jgi:cyanuric acid amidohydrolase
MAGPAAMSGLIGLIEGGALDPAHIAAILVKTESNGGVNNFTREYTCATIAATLAPYLHAIVAEVERQIAMVVSCGRTDALHHG